MKKLLSIMLSVSMLFPFCSSLNYVSAADTPAGTAISSVEEFLNMDPSGVYYLAKNIDFSGHTYNQNLYTKAFNGVLDGNGHSLLGITVTATNSDAGIFANQFGGKLMNLTFGAENAPATVTSTGSGYSVAIVAGTMVGGATFENVTIYANVSGDGKTAGFTSYMPNGKLTITNSKVYGTVKGNPAAGFVTMADNGSSDIEIVGCENHANITAQNLSAGGFYANHANVSGSRKCNLTIKGCVNYGSVSATDWRAGGIVGEFTEEKSSTLTIEYCYNLGSVTMTGGGGYAAGIAGGMCFDAPTGARRISNVYNAGLIRNTANSGNVFAIAFAQNQSDLITIENAAYVEGTSSKNCAETNVTKVADKAAMLATVSKYPNAGNGFAYIADTSNINDGYPILAIQNLNHANVQTYSCGRMICKDCQQILSLPENEKHSYTKTTTAPNGYLDGYITSVCKHCSDTKVQVDKSSQHSITPVDGAYVLTKPEHLMWYAANQNAGLLIGNERVVLGADLDMKGFDFTPIASGNKAFIGTFDGCGHTISNLTVETDGFGGLFAKAGMGAKISNLIISNANVSAKSAAGTLMGTAVNGSIVKIEAVAIVDSTIQSGDEDAGGLVGTTGNATEVTVHSVVADKVSVSGKSVGGLFGNGNNAVMKHAYANAMLTANGGKTGTLAVHSSGFSAEYCGYSKSTKGTAKDGTAYADEAFSSGEIAYLINTFGGNKRFSIQNDRTVLSDLPIGMVRLGSKKVYTNNILSANGNTAVYALPSDSGMTIVILQIQNADERLVDSTIEINGKQIAFKDLSLCKYVSAGGKYYMAQPGSVMYSISVEQNNAPTVKIGSSFSGAVTVVK